MITLPNISHLYAGEHRYYHNWSHVKDVLSVTEYLLECAKWGLSREQGITVGRAIAYHDVFCGKNHEVASASLCLTETNDTLAAWLILKSTTHTGETGIDEMSQLLGKQFDVRFIPEVMHIVSTILHDADLWSLASDEVTFSKNSINVILEDLLLHRYHTSQIISGMREFFKELQSRAERNVLFLTPQGKLINENALRNITNLLSTKLKQPA